MGTVVALPDDPRMRRILAALAILGALTVAARADARPAGRDSVPPAPGAPACGRAVR